MAGLRRKKGGKAGFEDPYCGPPVPSLPADVLWGLFVRMRDEQTPQDACREATQSLELTRSRFLYVDVPKNSREILEEFFRNAEIYMHVTYIVNYIQGFTQISFEICRLGSEH